MEKRTLSDYLEKRTLFCLTGKVFLHVYISIPIYITVLIHWIYRARTHRSQGTTYVCMYITKPSEFIYCICLMAR